MIDSSKSDLSEDSFKELSSSDIIIAGGEKNEWDYPLEVKIEDVYSYILKNYELKERFNNWEVFVKKY